MARPRVELGRILKDILGSSNVYFQSPESVKMKYPAIRYELSGVEKTPADNLAYLNHKRYVITVIDSNPDSTIYERVLELPTSRLERIFRSDNLYHYLIELYF